MKLLNDYENLRDQIFDYFGYKEGWVVIPLDDSTNYYWSIDDEDSGPVVFADTVQELNSKSGQYYECYIYTQRHLEKYVYRGKDYTMIVVDTNTDGNKFLSIFDNKKEIKEGKQTMKAAWVSKWGFTKEELARCFVCHVEHKIPQEACASRCEPCGIKHGKRLNAVIHLYKEYQEVENKGIKGERAEWLAAHNNS